MLLEIILQKRNVKLIIKVGEEIIAEHGWEGDLSLSEKLLLEIDNLLKKNNLSNSQIEKAVAIYDDESSVTSARIVQTVADAWNVVSDNCK